MRDVDFDEFGDGFGEREDFAFVAGFEMLRTRAAIRGDVEGGVHRGCGAF